MSFKEKYLKYKNKYLELKKQIGGCIGGELCENASSRFEDFLQFNDGQYVLPYLQYPEGCALGAVGPVTMAMASTVRRWDWLPFFVGTKGNGDGQFNTPMGVAFSSGSDIVVCDTFNHRIQVFDHCGNYVHKWGKFGSAKGEFDVPTSVAISSTDEVYVCDSNNHRIQVFRLNGTHMRTFGKKGRSNGQFRFPCSLAIYNDKVFVSDSHNHRIQIFDLYGNYSGQWGTFDIKSGEFNTPGGLAVSAAGVVVCDPFNHMVQVFDLSGTLIKAYSDSSPNPKENWSPHYGAISSTNEVFISDYNFDRVLVFMIDGTFIREVELPAGTNEEFMPAGIAVSLSDVIIICDNYTHRIYIMPHGA